MSMMRSSRCLVFLGQGTWLRTVRSKVPTSRRLCSTAAATKIPFSCENIVKSPYPDIEIPSYSVDEFVWRKFNKFADKTAVVCAQTGRSYTYNTLRQHSENFAQALRSQLGLDRGDVIALMSPNVPEYCTAVLGAITSGVIVTTLNPIYTPEEIAKQLSDSGAKAIITLSALHQSVQAARKILPESQQKIPIITIKHLPTDIIPEGCIDFSKLCSYNGPSTDLGRAYSEDLVLLPYSSGTTGLPKGVQLTHKNVVANLAQISYHDIILNLETTPEWQDRVSAVLPLYHIYGLVLVFLNAMAEGCQLITMPRFTPDSYHGMIKKYKPTMLYTAPPIVLFLNNFPDVKPEHLESVRRVMCGAAPLAHTDIEKFNEKFHVKGESKIIQGYGLTESSPLTHTQRSDVSTIEGGIGWAIPNTECRIIALEDDKTSLGIGATGQLAVRGPQVMRGYHNNLQATAETIDSEGWLRTGDIAHYDADGQFHITDRLKELIKVKGFQVAPAELEGILRVHPGVLDVGVTGVPDVKGGEAPKAFVVRRPGKDTSVEDLQKFVAEKVAPFKRLTGGVVFVDTIPKNPSGKILRRELKNM